MTYLNCFCLSNNICLLKAIHNLDKVRGNAHSSDITTGTGTLNDQGIGAVSLGVEADDVVTTLQTGNGTVLVEVLQADLDSFGGNVNATDISHNLALLLSGVLDVGHLGVEFRETGHELGNTLGGRGERSQGLGDKRLNGERIGA